MPILSNEEIKHIEQQMKSASFMGGELVSGYVPDMIETVLDARRKLDMATAELQRLFNDQGSARTSEVLENILGHKVEWPMKEE